MHVRKLLILPLFLLIITPERALAQASTDVSASTLDSIVRQFNLDEVTVSARRREEPVIPVQKLQGARLEGLSTQSVADAVRYFSGVQIKDYGGVGGLKTVDVRSMGTNHLGVFYDGIEIGNAQNGTVDLGKFSMDNIEEIALYNGQKSEIFQPAKDFGSAGTLYIKTRRPRFTPGKNYNLNITMKAGTFGLTNPSVLYEQKLTDNIHFSANAEYTFATGRYHFRYRKVMPDGSVAWDTTAVRQNGDVNAWRAEAGFFGYLPEGKWHVKGYCYGSEKGIPGAIVNNVWKNSQRQWDRNAFVQGNFTKRIARGYDLQVNAKYSNDWMRYLNPDTTLMYIDNSFTQQEVYLSMAHRIALLGPNSIFRNISSKNSPPKLGGVPEGGGSVSSDINWDLSLSADWQWNYLEGNLANFVFPERNTVLVAAATQFDWTYIKAQASVLGTFVYDQIHPDRYHNPSNSSNLSNPSNSSSGRFQTAPQWTPAFFLTVHPYLQDLYLRAFYKRIFRMPTFNDLYYTDVGNIALQPEFTIQYDGGAEYTKTWQTGILRAIDVKADGYFNQVKNKIVAIPKGNGQYRWQMMNLGYVEIRGCDLNASATISLFEWSTSQHGSADCLERSVDKNRLNSSNRPTGASSLLLTLAAAYTYQRAQDFSDPTEPLTYGGQIAYIPWHSGSATANLQWYHGGSVLSVNYAFIYVGERYHNSANIPANYERPWYTHDLSASYEMPLGNSSPKVGEVPEGQRSMKGGMKSLYFALEINNLLNQQYEVILNYPMPGINGKAVIRVMF